MSRICPVCGEVVPERAKACPECGADEQTGWSEEAYAPQPDLPDQEFDYEEFVEREFEGKEPETKKLHWIWWLAAIALIFAFLAWVW